MFLQFDFNCKNKVIFWNEKAGRYENIKGRTNKAVIVTAIAAPFPVAN